MPFWALKGHKLLLKLLAQNFSKIKKHVKMKYIHLIQPPEDQEVASTKKRKLHQKNVAPASSGESSSITFS